MKTNLIGRDVPTPVTSLNDGYEKENWYNDIVSLETPEFIRNVLRRNEDQYMHPLLDTVLFQIHFFRLSVYWNKNLESDIFYIGFRDLYIWFIYHLRLYCVLRF